MSVPTPDKPEVQSPRWRPLSRVDRRVVGVLVEKAKTTPDGYPMSVSALRSGCNQKSNRDPQMELEIEEVEESLTRLRAAGAVAEVHSDGRIARYRHYMYDWLGVDKVELAVMSELLLRGTQTEGELRGRAARMEPIADLAALRPVLASLKAKGLVIALSPEGRGHVVTHALYEPQEMEKVRAEFNASSAVPRREPAEAEASPAASAPRGTTLGAGSTGGEAAERDSLRQTVDQLRRELEELRAEVDVVRQDLQELRSALS